MGARPCPAWGLGPTPGRRLGILAWMPGLRILTLAPRVDERAGVLRARSSWLVRLLTLGAFSRQVLVDRRAGYVFIERRLLWGVRRKRVIPFRMIRRIAYDYDRTLTSLHGTRHGATGGDEIDRFEVALIVCMRDDVPESHKHLYEERVLLFAFHGEGQSRGYGVRLDFQGQQEALSRHYVERLRELIGVGFGHELGQLQDASGRAWACSSCGRPGPPRAGRCYYCGGNLESRG